MNIHGNETGFLQSHVRETSTSLISEISARRQAYDQIKTVFSNMSTEHVRTRFTSETKPVQNQRTWHKKSRFLRLQST
jgi:hypothetical protein